jgi:hypothetical protein
MESWVEIFKKKLGKLGGDFSYKFAWVQKGIHGDWQPGLAGSSWAGLDRVGQGRAGRAGLSRAKSG